MPLSQHLRLLPLIQWACWGLQAFKTHWDVTLLGLVLGLWLAPFCSLAWLAPPFVQLALPALPVTATLAPSLQASPPQLASQPSPPQSLGLQASLAQSSLAQQPTHSRVWGLASAQASQFVSLNLASAKQLQQLPGIGPKLAARIVQYRQQHGPFTSVASLTEVRGIGKKTLAKLTPFLTL